MDYFPIEAYRPASLQCIIESAVRRNVPADLLLAIAQIEGGKEGVALKNTDGSFDFGRMGINSKHLKELSSYGVSAEVATAALMNDGCYNIEMSAFLVQRHLTGCKREFWQCAARYHSKTPSKNAIYRTKLIQKATAWRGYLTANYPTKGYSND